jgi:hypothetical protein
MMVSCGTVGVGVCEVMLMYRVSVSAVVVAVAHHTPPCTVRPSVRWSSSPSCVIRAARRVACLSRPHRVERVSKSPGYIDSAFYILYIKICVCVCRVSS